MLGLRCERDGGESTSAKSWSTKAETTNDLTTCRPGAKLSKADGGAQTFPTAVARLHALINEAQEKKQQPFDGCPVALRDDDLSFALRQVVENSDSAAACDLLKFFEQPHMRGLLFAFDCLTRRDFDSSLPEVPHEVDEDEGLAVRIVRLEQNGALIIARIIRGGVADRSGCLNSGDQVIEVNGVNVVGKRPTDVVKLLNSSSGSVTFKLIPAPAQLAANGFSCSDTSGCGTPVFLRAMFDYNPNDDFYNPCPEASLAFGRGDILRLCDLSDENWWQAKLCHSSNEGNVGLVPSSKLLKSIDEAKRTKDLAVCSGFGTSRRFRSAQHDGHLVDEPASDVLKTYEEVVLYRPVAGFHRPIVLIGPTGVGRTELKRRLIATQPTKFGATIPYTSRTPKAGEIEGVNYHFTSRAQMEKWIRDNRLIEYGEFKGNLYGTCVDSVKELMDQGRVCVLNPHPQAIKLLRTGELKPYFVYVRPPPFPTLKATRTSQAERGNGALMSNEDFEQMIEQGKALETIFGCFFDYVLVNSSLEVAVRELLDITSSLELESHWVPSAWL
ncbi:Guanylate kinase family protein [Trichuris trichiura]|uniref:Guanylate kinase family protein n=1 Tax=Trichuris trichiura TaxID=36087 RepID=A0A077ZCW0_TRITR|nr:Guanylate kinase family protein [Trichuris trichiura]